LTGGSPHEF
jgi:hypothetical protein